MRTTYVGKIACLMLLFTTALSFGQTAPAAQSQVPRLIRFSGNLKDSSGNALTGVTGLTFSLYKDEQGGAALWIETQNVQLDSNGHYSVLLGAGKSDGVPMELFASSEARWLGVQPAGQPEQPRVLLLSVPYALKAGDAETVGGLPASAFALAHPASQPANAAEPFNVRGLGKVLVQAGTGTTNYIPLWTSSKKLGNSILYQSGSSIGIGTATPAATLDVNGGAYLRGNSSISGLLGINTSAPVAALDVASGDSIVRGATNFGGVGSVAYSYLGDTNNYIKAAYGVGVSIGSFLGTDALTVANGGAVGIGTTTPKYTLHVNGTLRSETGVSVGGSAQVNVDAVGVYGGRFTVLPNGNVGIGTPSPQAKLDVAGNMRINGDTAMSSAPRMTFSGFLPGDMGWGHMGGMFIPDRAITITRLTATMDTQGYGCATVPVVAVYNNSQGNFATLPLPNGTYTADSGALAVAVPAGTQLLIGDYNGGNCGFGDNMPANVNVSVEYSMQ